MQPSDRVLAKTIVRIFVGALNTFSDDADAKANALTLETMLTVPDIETASAVQMLIREVGDELQAENEGRASPYPQGAPQPSVNVAGRTPPDWD